MHDEISAALKSVGPAARRRLGLCVPVLTEAISNLAVPPAGCLTLAAATRNSAVVLSSADGWPAFDRCAAVSFAPDGPAAALAAAIENTAAPRSNDIVMVASAVLLGRDGLKAHAADTARIVRSGRLPLTIMLLDQTGDDIAMICTTVALAAATVH